MKFTHRFWRYLLVPLSLAGMLSVGLAAELNPAALIYKLPDQIPWGPVDPRGAQSAVVVGDPNKPGFYMVYNKWTKGNHFSRPHFHPNDRYRSSLGRRQGRRCRPLDHGRRSGDRQPVYPRNQMTEAVSRV